MGVANIQVNDACSAPCESLQTARWNVSKWGVRIIILAVTGDNRALATDRPIDFQGLKDCFHLPFLDEVVIC